jgi:hypothetical protein
MFSAVVGFEYQKTIFSAIVGNGHKKPKFSAVVAFGTQIRPVIAEISLLFNCFTVQREERPRGSNGREAL